MPSLTIDGKQITVPEGTTIMQAAEQLNIHVPFYCYHPGLSIAGNCRICMVEVEKMPKPQIACYTKVADGMVVHTNTEKAITARKDVLEYLLANHPLDCPVCDQAGECWLQDYYMEYGQYDPKFNEQKVKKPKAVPIGPTVMLDAERCILCSRCVRFCDEITKTGELGIFNRGDHAEIGVAPGKELNNNYSGNVVDICPVGALTDRDFRFKCRVWYLAATDSVCPGCSKGCNIQIHANRERELRPHIAEGDRVMRLKPRYNPSVNQWWMCDVGRYGYKPIDDNRIQVPHRRENGALKPISWDEALGGIAAALKQAAKEQVGIVPSPQLTNEDLYLLRKVFVELLGYAHMDQTTPVAVGENDALLLQSDRNPNTVGAVALGALTNGTAKRISGTLELAASGKLQVLYIVTQDLVQLAGEAAVKAAATKTPLVIYQGTNWNRTCDYAHVVLPSASYAEKDGTFTNHQGRVQRIQPAFPPLGQAQWDWHIFLGLARRLGHPLTYPNPEAVFNEMAQQVPAFRGLTYQQIGSQGQLAASS